MQNEKAHSHAHPQKWQRGPSNLEKRVYNTSLCLHFLKDDNTYVRDTMISLHIVSYWSRFSSTICLYAPFLYLSHLFPPLAFFYSPVRPPCRVFRTNTPLPFRRGGVSVGDAATPRFQREYLFNTRIHPCWRNSRTIFIPWIKLLSRVFELVNFQNYLPRYGRRFWIFHSVYFPRLRHVFLFLCRFIY